VQVVQRFHVNIGIFRNGDEVTENVTKNLKRDKMAEIVDFI
jgi:hypothetical protein